MLRNILKTIVTPPVKERPGEWTQHPDYFVAKDALANGDAATAREVFARVLGERPQQLDAKAGLARASFVLGDPDALTLVDEVLGTALGGTTELLRVTLEELGPSAAAPALRPTMAWRVAQRLDAEGDDAGARPYYDVALRADGLVGLKARVRALELNPLPTVPALSAAADATAREPELQKRVTALLKKFVPAEPRSIELPPEDMPLEMEQRPPCIVPVRVAGRVDGGLVVVSSNGTNTLPFRRVLGLAVGIVPGADGRSTVLRAGLGDLGLDRLHPGVSPKEAYVRFLKDIELASGAKRLPAGTESGNLPRYTGAEEMTRACHGAV